VAVKSIRRKEFARLCRYSDNLTPFIGEGAEWFADDNGKTLAVIGRNRSRSIWNYVVLKQSAPGVYRVSRLGGTSSDLPTIRDECRQAVLEADLEPKIWKQKCAVPQEETPPYDQEKPLGSMIVVVLILVADAIVIAVTLGLVLHHYWR
jgi:hypothetical protein